MDLNTLAKIIEGNFSEQNWIEIANILNAGDIIKGHNRLLRSLYWNDDDYLENIRTVLFQIEGKNPELIQRLSEYVVFKFHNTLSSVKHSNQSKSIPISPHVFSIPTLLPEKNLIAVMLPFKYVSTFDAIKAACNNLKLKCMKADDIWEHETFIQDIFTLIYRSEIVIADFTDKNPNVFYEVGIAHTLGKVVIPISQNLSDVPSDLGHHRTLKYLSNTEGLESLKEELSQRLKTLLNHGR